VVAGVSNWGALGLLLGVAATRRELECVATVTSPAAHDEMLATCVQRAGAVDGTSGSPALTVDGVPARVHHEVISALNAAAKPCGRHEQML